MTRRRLTLAGIAVALVTLTAVGCSGAEPNDATYTFHPRDSGIKVDTPELRALKASADIESCPASKPTGSAPEQGLPKVTLPCLGGGRSVDLAGLRGPLVVNFWSQVCGPCRDESPLLQQLSSAAKGRVRVIGVDFLDARPGLAIAFAKNLGLTYPQVADPVGATKAPLHIAGLPYSFFVDSTGKVTYTQVGAITSSGTLASLVQQYLGVNVPLAGTS